MKMKTIGYVVMCLFVCKRNSNNNENLFQVNNIITNNNSDFKKSYLIYAYNFF